MYKLNMYFDMYQLSYINPAFDNLLKSFSIRNLFAASICETSRDLRIFFTLLYHRYNKICVFVRLISGMPYKMSHIAVACLKILFSRLAISCYKIKNKVNEKKGEFFSCIYIYIYRSKLVFFASLRNSVQIFYMYFWFLIFYS